jgi:hypothetical protein
MRLAATVISVNLHNKARTNISPSAPGAGNVMILCLVAFFAQLASGSRTALSSSRASTMETDQPRSETTSFSIASPRHDPMSLPEDGLTSDSGSITPKQNSDRHP